MDNERVERIRARAHAIWEEEGRPEGRDVEHWQRAVSDIDAVDAGSISETAGASDREALRRRKAGSESDRTSAGTATPASKNAPTAAREGGVDPVPRRASKASSGSGKGAAASPSSAASPAAREGGVEPVPRRGGKTAAGEMACHAEYRVLAADAPIAPKPANLSFEEAASLCFGGTTAMHFLRKARIAVGEKVLVIGASGAVGTAMVQVVRQRG